MSELHSVLCLVIPVNVLIFSFFKERGIFSVWGLLRIGFILAQAAAAVWLLNPDQSAILHRIGKDLLPLTLRDFTPLSQASLIAFVLAGIRLIIRQVSQKSSQDISFIAVLAGMLYVLHSEYDPIWYAILWGVSGIILITSIIQDSYSMAFSDELTGLPSRRALKQDMMKLGMNYAIAMLDIDHFKKFNDTYGHDTGDEVLRLVASTLREVAGGGRPFRYGGEEFTILFPGKSIQDALPHLEELREKVAKRALHCGEEQRKRQNKAQIEISKLKISQAHIHNDKHRRRPKK